MQFLRMKAWDEPLVNISIADVLSTVQITPSGLPAKGADFYSNIGPGARIP
jgi:hypothetical protein